MHSELSLIQFRIGKLLTDSAVVLTKGVTSSQPLNLEAGAPVVRGAFSGTRLEPRSRLQLQISHSSSDTCWICGRRLPRDEKFTIFKKRLMTG